MSVSSPSLDAGPRRLTAITLHVVCTTISNKQPASGETGDKDGQSENYDKWKKNATNMPSPF